MLEDAARWLRDQTLGALSVPVVYRRGDGDGDEKTIRAVIGTTLFQAEDSYGAVVSSEARDFLVSADELPEEPRKGDVVVWDTAIYEVMAPAGEPCWRWSDAYHTMRRIHTKETGEENNGSGQQH